MRTFVIAFGLAGLYTLLAPALPLVFCLTGVVLFLASAAFLYLRSRGQR